MNLPKDPIMLLSVINMQLRDNFSNFDELCKAENILPSEIAESLEKVGYTYDAELNQFR